VLAEPAAGELFVACGGSPQPVRKIALAVTRACGIEGNIEVVPLDQAPRDARPDGRLPGVGSACRLDQGHPLLRLERAPAVDFDEIFSGSYLST